MIGGEGDEGYTKVEEEMREREEEQVGQFLSLLLYLILPVVGEGLRG